MVGEQVVGGLAIGGVGDVGNHLKTTGLSQIGIFHCQNLIGTTRCWAVSYKNSGTETYRFQVIV